jgi:protein O-GlcNAc transferase
MSQMTLPQAIQLAMQHHQAGRFAEAESLYRQILAKVPNHVDVLCLLGRLEFQAKHYDSALECLSRAVKLAPEFGPAHLYLGMVWHARNQLEKARVAYRRAIELKPELVEAHVNLARIESAHGHFEEAAAGFERAVALEPDSVDHRYDLGKALLAQFRVDESAAQFRQVLARVPGHVDGLMSLSAILMMQQNFAEAEVQCRRVLAIKPDYAEAYVNLAKALKGQGRLDDSIECLQSAIKVNFDLGQAHESFGIVANYLADLLVSSGRIQEGLEVFRDVISANPGNQSAYSDFLYYIHFDPDSNLKTISCEHARWRKQQADPLERFIEPHRNNRDPNRRIKIGYVSPDFRDQAERFFVYPFLEAHDRQQFEVHCYSSVGRPDEFTDRMRRIADEWHDVFHLNNAALAEKIRADGIDILVDLTMHMAQNRILVFARKPAPVQVTWLAYPGSTGLGTIDYRLTDAYMDPPDSDQVWSSEAAVRLPDCWCCYHAMEDLPILSDLPADRAKGITFGSLNSFRKLNKGVLNLWSKVLLAVPESRLLLLSEHGEHRQRVRETVEQFGVSGERVEFFSFTASRAEYLKGYERIDIALDPFPYNGITTTCDALWLGVPVLTLVGDRPSARAGLSLLTTAGFPELIANSPVQFLEQAANLANDRVRLRELRKNVGLRMRQSVLADAPRFARNVESAYREMWRKWCAS